MTHYDESLSTIYFSARAMNVRIHAVMNENIEYKVQRINRNDGEVNNQLLEENEELKSQIDELRSQLQQNSTTQPDTEVRNGHQKVKRTRSPTPSLPSEYERSMVKNYNKENRLDHDSMGVENVSPATKSMMSDRSWIDNKEVMHNATQESAQLIIEKLSKVINHMQNELSKNAITIAQLIEENRHFQSRGETSSYSLKNDQ